MTKSEVDDASIPVTEGDHDSSLPTPCPDSYSRVRGFGYAAYFLLSTGAPYRIAMVTAVIMEASPITPPVTKPCSKKPIALPEGSFGGSNGLLSSILVCDRLSRSLVSSNLTRRLCSGDIDTCSGDGRENMSGMYRGCTEVVKPAGAAGPTLRQMLVSQDKERVISRRASYPADLPVRDLQRKSSI